MKSPTCERARHKRALAGNSGGAWLVAKWASLLVSLLLTQALAGSEPAIRLTNSRFRYLISDSAQNVAFEDVSSGSNYLAVTPASPCAYVRLEGKEHPATSAVLRENVLTLGFGNAQREVVLTVETHPAWIVLSVQDVKGGPVDAITFLNLPLTLKGRPDEPFGACALALNLTTRIDALPALQSHLRAGCEAKFGVIGARAAIVGAPMPAMLPAFQETLAGSSELPVSRVAGPWAREVAFNRGSYLFNFGSLTETNLSDWIDMVHSLGFTQIDNHGGGGFFRFGDFELDRQKWPDGWETWRRIVARLHEAKVDSIFHTYAFFIDKRSKYVTPVPDPRLAAFRAFTLSEAIGPEATEIPVEETTAQLTTITGFFEHNSVLLQLGNELVTFGEVSREAPWRFLKVQRGACGTRATAHERGATARHLKECFGLLVPDPESSLFEEIAANHADVVNQCGFDGIYLDAIDGSSILRGPDECWYWANKFVVEIQKRLKKPVGMEMSAMWHQFWQYRTRWQAWDYPQRGHTRFVDLHAAGVNGGLLLPLHLGWWGLQSFNPPQIEPTYPDVMETLGARLIGWDSGISLTAGVDRGALQSTPLFRRAVDILRTCEEARHAGLFSEPARARLREPGTAWALVKDSAARPRFRQTRPVPHVASQAEPWSLSWAITNEFATQPARFRLEALTSASTEETAALLLADLSAEPTNLWHCETARGISAPPRWQRRPAAEGQGAVSAPSANSPLTYLTITNAGLVPQNASWVRLQRTFNPPRSFKAHQGLTVEIEGDGSGALVGFRMESPHHLSFGAVADRYVPLDFKGRRHFTLVETESTRWNDYEWNDGKGLYNLYRETIDFGAVEKVTVWLQNLPPGRVTECAIGPVRAVPLVSVKLKNPKLVFDGITLELPCELPSGGWIEANGPEDCIAYGPKGETLARIRPLGTWPTLAHGSSECRFGCDVEGEGQAPARVKVTVFPCGDEL